MIGIDGKRDSGNSVLLAQIATADIYIYIYIYIYIMPSQPMVGTILFWDFLSSISM